LVLVTTLWTDIEILRFIDACEQGTCSAPNTGSDLLRTLAADRDVSVGQGDYAPFLRELAGLAEAELLRWNMVLIPSHMRQPTPAEPQGYLDHMREFALTYKGRNQARGRVIQAPLPDPAEDDGRSIATLTLEDVAKCIGRKYVPHQAVQLLIESGISLEDDPADEGETWEKLFVIFMMLEQGTSGQRRELRHFVGAWLDDQLRIGASDEERARIEPDLARQGWFVKDGRLVIGEPVRRGRGTQTPMPAVDRLHPTVWKAAETRWKTKHLHDAVIAASKAVNAMLQKKVGRNDVSEVKLIQPTFSSKPPTATEPRLRFTDIADRQTRDSVTAGMLQFGVGCFMAMRNPIGHRPDDEHKMTEQEALEQLAAWSLFARWIDRAEVVEAESASSSARAIAGT
jgi:uncharacterized protein (TIGR02391 family)